MRIHIPLPLRWADLDAYGHVNNAVMLRLLEEARIRAFWAADAGEELGLEGAPGTAILTGRVGSGTLVYLARQEIEYLAPVPYLRAPLDVQIWISRFGGASLDLCYEVRSPLPTPADDDTHLGAGDEVGQTLYVKAETTIVLVDGATEKPRRITAEERAAWEPYVEAPIEMRRR